MSKLKGAVSHHAAEVAELRADRQLAVEYLKAALESLDDPDDRAAGLLALRTVAEAYGGLAVVAAQAGISRESLYRTLSPNGNPTLKTLLAVLKTLGLRLSVEPENTRPLEPARHACRPRPRKRSRGEIIRRDPAAGCRSASPAAPRRRRAARTDRKSPRRASC